MDQYKLYTQYSGAVGKSGPDSREALELRELNRGDQDFLRFADAVDRLKRRIVDTPEPAHPAVAGQSAVSEPEHAAAAV